MFAVVKISGKQFTVSKGDVISVQKLEGTDGDTLTFSDVLLVSDGKDVKIGTPNVEGVKVKAKLVAQEKGEKLNVRRYKHKVRYRKSIGFREKLTKLEIVSIG